MLPAPRFTLSVMTTSLVFGLVLISHAAEAEQTPAATAPTVNFNPGEKYADETRMFQGISSLERSPGGRLWATWYGGGITEDLHNYIMLVTSNDDGKTWSEMKLVIDPDQEGPVRAFDPCPWVDPDGKLWLFWCQATRGGGGDPHTFAITTENPDEADPTWSKAQHIHDGVLMCKPTALSDGTWLLPTAIWGRDESCRVVASTDKGKTWQLRGAASVPEKKDRNCDEPMIVEKKDGTLWQLVRTGYGIGESFSCDQGRTWTPVTEWDVKHTASRFFIRRLQSGNLLLVKHGPIETRTGRSHLTAYVSKDDGETWDGGLLLDERSSVSYPDGAQAADGTIYLTYDYDRRGQKFIYMTSFTEEDILARKPVSDTAQMRVVINQAHGLNPGMAKAKDLTNVKLDSNADGAEMISSPTAKLETSAGEIRPVKNGAVLFTDRGYTMKNIPSALSGKQFVVSGIGGATVTCQEAGVVYVVTPTEGRNNDSLANELIKQGFAKVKLPEFMLFDESNPLGNICTTYQKELQQGETLKVGKWGVIIFESIVLSQRKAPPCLRPSLPKRIPHPPLCQRLAVFSRDAGTGFWRSGLASFALAIRLAPAASPPCAKPGQPSAWTCYGCWCCAACSWVF